MSSSSLVSQAASSLEQEANRILMGNPYLPANYRLDVRESSGGLRLSGKVDSYFHKQMAQESLRDLPGVKRIENMLEVLS
jgi:osmotically-inducible protein OsmY